MIQMEMTVDPQMWYQSPKFSVQWVLGPQGEGDCHEICAAKNGACDERMGREAASDPNSVNFEGIGCKGRNGWNYGQGFSQCLDKGCCGDSSCQFHCSATSRWPGCKIENAPWKGDGGHHGRLCPCRDLGSSESIFGECIPKWGSSYNCEVRHSNCASGAVAYSRYVHRAVGCVCTCCNDSDGDDCGPPNVVPESEIFSSVGFGPSG